MKRRTKLGEEAQDLALSIDWEIMDLALEVREVKTWGAWAELAEDWPAFAADRLGGSAGFLRELDELAREIEDERIDSSPRAIVCSAIRDCYENGEGGGPEDEEFKLSRSETAARARKLRERVDALPGRIEEASGVIDQAVAKAMADMGMDADFDSPEAIKKARDKARRWLLGEALAMLDQARLVPERPEGEAAR